jgi:hypothetical protein
MRIHGNGWETSVLTTVHRGDILQGFGQPKTPVEQDP